MEETGSYHLRYAPSLPLLGRDVPLERRLEIFALKGLHAVEYSCAGRPGCGLVLEPLNQVKALRKQLDHFAMEMGVFVVNPGAFQDAGLCDEAQHPNFLTQLRRAVEYHQTIENRYCTLLVGSAQPNTSPERQRENVVQALKASAEILESTDLILVVEPINLMDRPDSFLVNSDQAAEILQAVASPHVRMLFDLFHQQLTGENLVAKIRKHQDCIGYYQFADVPGRKEPGTGRIDCQAVFRAIHETGYRGFVGMEHALSLPREAGLERCLDAYRRADTW